MVKAVIFDMYETLITLYNSELYKGKQIAADMKLPEPKFREIWDASDDDRTLGTRSFEDVITEILNANGIFEKELFEKIIKKRYICTAEAFCHKDPDIIPMLRVLKEKGIKIGLITNCYFEERDAIKNCDMYEYFDCICMSCEIGIKKPDLKVFALCAEKLGVNAEECLYVGDGGSNELQAAKAAGMKPLQAVWYLREGVDQPCGKMDEFDQTGTPLDVLSYIC